MGTLGKAELDCRYRNTSFVSGMMTKVEKSPQNPRTRQQIRTLYFIFFLVCIYFTQGYIVSPVYRSGRKIERSRKKRTFHYVTATIGRGNGAL